MNDLIEQNPQLLRIAAEIEAILDREKIAGAFQIASSTHAEFRIRLPEWSAIQFHHDPEHGPGFQIKSSSERNGPEHLSSSVHLLFSMRDMLFEQAKFFSLISAQVEVALENAGIEIDHTSLQEMAAQPDPPLDEAQ